MVRGILLIDRSFSEIMSTLYCLPDSLDCRCKSPPENEAIVDNLGLKVSLIIRVDVESAQTH